ncbi:olfactory receptor 52K2-like [Alligator mississippiensis]|uniref:Olfactory receptor 52K2-like n=1 Tax=Alligator mississippiensis TaxID=8496 RepID=A0A151NH85_ALLMI|nr:olfactory receptor 52K2-like [Alligator mississippiensis]
MSTLNSSTPSPTTFILIGIPGLEDEHIWISIPFCFMYLMAVVGNCTILFIIKAEPSLHEPMHLFLCMLSVTDLVLSSSTVPKMLSIFWFSARQTNFGACLTQMFFIHSFSAMESGFFLAMAYDRYVAICHPLQHATALSNGIIAKITLAVVARGVVLFSPHPFLVSSLPFCRTNVISHSYCEFMALVKLACADTTARKAYSLTIASLAGFSDIILIALSYVMILRSVFSLPSKEARLKSLGTCSSHICVILVFYTPAFFSFLTHRFGHVAPHVHILVANLYLVFPPMMNPIIYGVRTKGIRQRVLKACGFQHT